MSNTKTIAKNTAWYGLETSINIFVTMFTSIAIARTLGPTKMGDLIYVIWISGVVTSLGSLGIPATMRKYMAEFLGKGDRGTARYVYIQTLLLQMGMATLATAGVIVWVLTDARADYRLAAILVALSMWPAMVNTISGQANMAAEQLSANLPASIVSILAYLVAIIATVVFKWGLVGVGGSMLFMRCIDFLVRIIPTARRILGWETEHIHPEGLQRRMMMFAWQSIVSTLIALVVWERSELFLLKHLCSDIRQIAFYSVAFSMAERLLLSASIFGGAIGSTIFAQYGRDKSKLPALAASAFRYLALTSIPLHFIFTALAVPLLSLLYGKAYNGAAAVVTLAPLLCLPKAFMVPINVLLQSMEKQKYLIAATLLAGVVDIGVAWSLIGAHGAVGACIGSGAAQVTAIGMMWAIGIHLLKIKLPWIPLAKITVASIVAALVAHIIAMRLHPILGLLLGGTASLIVLLGLFYILRVVEPADRDRFRTITQLLPKPLARRMDSLLLLLVPAAPVRSGQNGAPENHPKDISASQAQPLTVTEDGHREYEQDEDLTISVVIPAYNAERYIRRCLESVFTQTLKPMEVIVVDDGSADSTAVLARKLGARVITKQNGGPAAARNTGINSTTGRWIAMLDADDYWDPEKLERQVAALRPGAVLVYCGARVFDECGSRGMMSAADPTQVKEMLRYRNPITTSTVLARRDALQLVKGFREDVSGVEDWDLWMRMRSTGEYVGIDSALAHYYVSSQGYSVNAERTLRALELIMEETLLDGLKGFERWAWRRRIRSMQLSSAGLIARENGFKGELRYMIQAVWQWPSPWWLPERILLLVVTLRNRVFSQAKANRITPDSV